MSGKKIILIRHGKSSWEHNVSDLDRPLKKRGKSDAEIVSNNFKSKNYSIDKVFTSNAKRAYSTCKIFQNQLNWDENLISIDESLYDFSGESVLRFVSNLDNNLNTVVIFGHNHAFTSIVNMYGDRYINNLPTSGLVVLNFNVESWEFVKYGRTELIMFPKDFK